MKREYVTANITTCATCWLELELYYFSFREGNHTGLKWPCSTLISMQETFWGSLCMRFLSVVYACVLSVCNSVVLGFLDVCDGPTSWSFCWYSRSGNKTPQLLGTNWRAKASQPQKLIVQTLCRLCNTFQQITWTHLFQTG